MFVSEIDYWLKNQNVLRMRCTVVNPYVVDQAGEECFGGESFSNADIQTCPPEKLYLDECSKPKPAKLGIY